MPGAPSTTVLCIERSLLRAQPFGTIRATQPGANPETLVTSMPQGAQKFATILLQEAKQLLAMDRY